MMYNTHTLLKYIGIQLYYFFGFQLLVNQTSNTLFAIIGLLAHDLYAYHDHRMFYEYSTLNLFVKIWHLICQNKLLTVTNGSGQSSFSRKTPIYSSKVSSFHHH